MIKPRFNPRLCRFLMKIIIAINPVRACARTSAKDDSFPWGGGGGGGGGWGGGGGGDMPNDCI